LEHSVVFPGHDEIDGSENDGIFPNLVFFEETLISVIFVVKFRGSAY